MTRAIDWPAEPARVQTAMELVWQGHSQGQAAKHLGVSKQTVSRWLGHMRAQGWSEGGHLDWLRSGGLDAPSEARSVEPAGRQPRRRVSGDPGRQQVTVGQVLRDHRRRLKRLEKSLAEHKARTEGAAGAGAPTWGDLAELERRFGGLEGEVERIARLLDVLVDGLTRPES